MSKEAELLESILQKTIAGKIKWDDMTASFKGYSLYIQCYEFKDRIAVNLIISSSCVSIFYLNREYIAITISTLDEDLITNEKLIQLSKIVEENKNRIKNNNFNNMLKVFK